MPYGYDLGHQYAANIRKWLPAYVKVLILHVLHCIILQHQCPVVMLTMFTLAFQCQIDIPCLLVRQELTETRLAHKTQKLYMHVPVSLFRSWDRLRFNLGIRSSFSAWHGSFSLSFLTKIMIARRLNWTLIFLCMEAFVLLKRFFMKSLTGKIKN